MLVCFECLRIKLDIVKNKYIIEYMYLKIYFWNMLDMWGFDSLFFFF